MPAQHLPDADATPDRGEAQARGHHCRPGLRPQISAARCGLR
jgi:hypothetical protein